MNEEYEGKQIWKSNIKVRSVYLYNYSYKIHSEFILRVSQYFKLYSDVC